GRRLTSEADALLHLDRVPTGVEPAHEDRARVGGDQRGEDVDGGGLPGSVGAEQGEDLAALDDEIEVLDHRLRAERLAQVLRLEGGCRGHGGPFRRAVYEGNCV